MHQHHHHPKFLHHLIFKKELDEIYITFALRAFCFSMISLFIPFYLLKLDYSVTSIFVYFLVQAIVYIPCSFLSAKISSKIGVKHTILWSSPLFIAVFLLFFSLGTHHWPLWIISIVSGLANAFFWVSFHTDFATFSEKKYRSRELGMTNIVALAGGILGPIIGGLVITVYGFPTLFILASILLFFSAIPLFFSKELHVKKRTFSFKKFFTKETFKRHAFVTLGGFEIYSGHIIWPIFIFMTITQNYNLLGALYAILFFFTLLSIFYVSRLSDKIGHIKLLRFGGIVTSLLWIVRTVITTTKQLFILEPITGIVKSTQSLPFESRCYDNFEKKDILNSVLTREVFLNIGIILFFSFAIITQLGLKELFIVHATVSLLYLFI